MTAIMMMIMIMVMIMTALVISRHDGRHPSGACMCRLDAAFLHM